MSTRACYVFSDDHQPDAATFVGHVVYKHHDGYPSGAIEHLAKALPFAWPLPRFEADECAAAFVAGNKDCSGGVRLFGHGPWTDLVSSDSEYVYLVAPDAKGVVTVRGLYATGAQIFEAPLATIGETQIEEGE